MTLGAPSPVVRINPNLTRIGTIPAATRSTAGRAAPIANDNGPTSRFSASMPDSAAMAALWRQHSTAPRQIAAAYSTAPTIRPGQFFEIYA